MASTTRPTAFWRSKMTPSAPATQRSATLPVSISPTGCNDIYIGNVGGSGGESNRSRIGTVGTQTTTFIVGISEATVPGGVRVIVGNNGKLSTVVSAERLKDEIKPMDNASEAILALKSVTFRYKKELDPEGVPSLDWWRNNWKR